MVKKLLLTPRDVMEILGIKKRTLSQDNEAESDPIHDLV